MAGFPRIVPAMIFALLVSSCAGRDTAVPDKQSLQQRPTDRIGDINSPVASSAKKRKLIIQTAENCLGQPYSWGGHSPGTGFDCSGLIFYAYGRAGVATPRTTTALFRSGRPVAKQALSAADLVFFKNPHSGKSLHVGVYIGDGKFIHAPGKGRRITLARMDNPYFRRYYLGSRALL